jgi:uncharacterized protein
MTIEASKKISNGYEILIEKRNEVLALAAKHKAHNLRIAKFSMEGLPDRDGVLDIIADFEEGFDPFYDYFGLMAELSELTGHIVAVVQEDTLRENNLEHLLGDTIEL